MKNKKNIKNIIFGLIIAVCALIIYSVVKGGGDNNGNSSLSSLVGSGSFGQVKNQTLNLLMQRF